MSPQCYNQLVRDTGHRYPQCYGVYRITVPTVLLCIQKTVPTVTSVLLQVYTGQHVTIVLTQTSLDHREKSGTD